MSIEAMKQALALSQSAIKTLESLGYTYHGGEYWKPPLGKPPEAEKQEPVGINGLTEAETNATASVMGLVNKQEPVAWLTDRDTMYFDKEDARRDCDGFIFPLGRMDKLVAPQRQWVGLTDEERVQLWEEWENGHVVEAVEAKLKEKNNG